MTNSAKNHFEVAVIGDWHLAFVSASVLASTGRKTALVKPLNLNSAKWESFPAIPVVEPGLEDMIKSAREKNLLQHLNGVDSDWSADLVWLAVDTPINDKDEPNVLPLIEIAKLTAKTKKNVKSFIISSQIPVGFCQSLEKEIGIPVAYVPENLRLGKGIETFKNADRTVIGATSPTTAQLVQELMSGFQTEFLLCNLQTSEMVKHANNAFLATSISFANELARLGEKFEVDSNIVGKALKLDKRIGQAAYVMPGLGFAGGTLPRDLRVLQQKGKEFSVPMPLVNAVLQVNENTTQALAEMVIDQCKGKPVLILGYTYKADTDTLRRSLSLDLAAELKKQKISVHGFDPFMNGKDLSGLNGLIQHHDQVDGLTETPAVVVVMTARPAFKNLDWSTLSKLWKTNTLVLDTQNILPADNVLDGGFTFKKLWSTATRKRNLQ